VNVTLHCICAAAYNLSERNSTCAASSVNVALSALNLTCERSSICAESSVNVALSFISARGICSVGESVECSIFWYHYDTPDNKVLYFLR